MCIATVIIDTDPCALPDPALAVPVERKPESPTKPLQDPLANEHGINMASFPYTSN